MVPENPGPPNQPNIFCAPCAKKTTPSTSLRSNVAPLSSVANSLRSISDLLSLLRPREPMISGPTIHEMLYPYIRILLILILSPAGQRGTTRGIDKTRLQVYSQVS